jgi:hypothetical protein
LPRIAQHATTSTASPWLPTRHTNQAAPPCLLLRASIRPHALPPPTASHAPPLLYARARPGPPLAPRQPARTHALLGHLATTRLASAPAQPCRSPACLQRPTPRLPAAHRHSASSTHQVRK